YSYIFCTGGIAGAIVANRLTENANFKVLHFVRPFIVLECALLTSLSQQYGNIVYRHSPVQ
ncbi:hypothetical protein BT96DRAFT_844720, partial [Gymnopus androsaceus JB14]